MQLNFSSLINEMKIKHLYALYNTADTLHTKGTQEVIVAVGTKNNHYPTRVTPSRLRPSVRTTSNRRFEMFFFPPIAPSMMRS